YRAGFSVVIAGAHSCYAEFSLACFGGFSCYLAYRCRSLDARSSAGSAIHRGRHLCERSWPALGSASAKRLHLDKILGDGCICSARTRLRERRLVAFSL